MTHKEIVDWYSDLRDTLWIYPQNSRTVNLMEEEPEEEVVKPVVTCGSCYCATACFQRLLKHGEIQGNDVVSFMESPALKCYICAEEVNSAE